MSKRLPRQQGFTLLEIMIALTIFAVISILAWQILDGAMRTTTATDTEATKLNQLQRAYNLLERDFFQLQARAPRNEPEVFRQDGNAVELSTLSALSGDVRLERVRWRLEEHRLWRDVWPAIDSPSSVKPEEVPILNDVKEMRWRFWRQDWQDAWTDAAHQPDGVELTLTLTNGETWRWVFLTPGEMPEIQLAKKPEAPADVASPPTSPAAEAATPAAAVPTGEAK